MPALMHLPTKVPSGICSASQTMISCVEVIQINTGMELKFRDWNHWRQPLFRREAAARAHHDLTNPPRNGGRSSHPHPSLQAISLGWPGRWPGQPHTLARCMGSQI